MRLLILDPEMFDGTHDEWIEYLTTEAARQRAEIARLRDALASMIHGSGYEVNVPDPRSLSVAEPRWVKHARAALAGEQEGA